MTPEVDRQIRLLEKGVITESEFFYAMLDALGNLPAGEQLAMLHALTSHRSEAVRAAVAQVQNFVQNRELSRDFEHVRRNSPLRPGCRLELFGSREFYASADRPWLNGREFCRATFVGFQSLGENLTPVALVEFDEAFDLPGCQGRFGVMFARYGRDEAAWAQQEWSVALSVVEARPNDLDGCCDTHPFTERQACYRVIETPDQPAGSSG